jgi:hypothetical protein
MDIVPFQHPSYMPALMYQWRILFYFADIILKPDFFEPSQSYELLFSFLGNDYKYTLRPRWDGRGAGTLRFARLFHFFAEASVGLKGVFANEVEFYIGDMLARINPMSAFTFG